MISRRNCVLLGVIGLVVPTPLMAESWRTYRNLRFGTTIAYPDRFRPGRPPENGDGLGFSSADGAAFSVWGSHNALFSHCGCAITAMGAYRRQSSYAAAVSFCSA
jgi:hypothetical protein